MATRFEMVLHGENPISLRAAADEAFHEIERLHAQLSLYSSSSEISFINARAAHETVRVEPGLFRLLQLAKRVYEETNGAFDITIAPLLRCWGFMGESGALPSEEQIAEARSNVGMQHVILNEQNRTIRFEREKMMLDLGSIGKGYALEIATELLVDAGIQSGLIHGGTSTVSAIGHPPGMDAWRIAISVPPETDSSDGSDASRLAPNSQPECPMAMVSLKNEGLSVSAVHGKCFRAGGKIYGHVIDPRTGVPAQSALLAAVVLPSATETDAFSTALLLNGFDGHDDLAKLRTDMRTLVLRRNSDNGDVEIQSKGIAILREGGALV